jgi:Ca2+-binding EF-hand superfamily protein/tRNA A-37 threonylcarbamoyl transferase component Bud32
MDEKSRKLAFLTGQLKVSNISNFDSYLKDIWIDLVSRTTKNENDRIDPEIRQDLIGITKLIFIKYYSLPGIIADRLYRVFDSNNNGILEYNEFKTGMITLFYENYEKTLRFIFDFYDFDGDGKISKEDIKVVLLYVSYSNEKEEDKNDEYKNVYEKKLNNILDTCFPNKLGHITFIEFANIVEKINCDIYFMIYIFLLKQKPFSYESIELYQNNEQNQKIITYNKTYYNYDLYLHNINNAFFNRSDYPLVSNNNLRLQSGLNYEFQQCETDPNASSSFFNLRDKNINSSYTGHRINFKGHDKYSGIKQRYFQKMMINEDEFFKQNFENTIIDSIIPYNIVEELDKIKYNEKDFEDIYENGKKNIKEHLESESNNYNGYIYKLVKEKMVKIWFKLFYKDLFYYKNKDDKNHKGMHNLSGLFLKKEATKILDNKIYYSFSIIFPNKKRTYFCDDMKEFKNWIKHLRIAINYSNILDLYIIKEKIGSGSFSEVKLAINKITKQKVAVKIMDKKKMNSSRLESARIEIEIMKICQFPYIIKFIEAYENIDYIYIFMEYCQGGTLFEFMKKRNFLLSEQLAATITYKLCLAIYYFHSYGITHRDLKPDNILMTSNDDNADIKILDFGLGKIIGPNETCSEPYGTVIYCAPEILLDRPYTKNVDSWSLGIITYCLLFGRFPFYHDDRRLLKISIINSQPVYKAKNLNNVSDDAINFMQNLLIKNPNKRMNIEQALEHKWLKKFNQNNIIQLKNLDKDKKSMIESFNLKNYRIKQFCS